MKTLENHINHPNHKNNEYLGNNVNHHFVHGNPDYNVNHHFNHGILGNHGIINRQE